MKVKERVEALRKEMKKRHIDVYYIPSEDDHMSEYSAPYFKARAFMSGFSGSAGCLIVTMKEAGLWTDGRYFVQAEKQLKGSGIKLFRMAQEGVPTSFDYMMNNTPAKGTLGFDGKVVPYQTVLKMQEILDKKGASIALNEDLADIVWKERPAMPDEQVYVVSEKYTGESSASKLKRIRKDMKEKGASVLVIPSLEDVCWLYNIRGNDIPNTPCMYAFAAVTADGAYLYVNKAQLRQEVVDELEGVEVKGYEQIADDLKNMHGQKIWTDPTKLNAYLYSMIDDTNEIIEGQCPCVMGRAIKNKVEIKQTRIAHEKDGVAMVRFLMWLEKAIQHEVVTEVSACDKLYELRAQGEDYIEPSFTTIGAYGPNAAMMHYSATPDSYATLERKGFFLVDSGGTYFGGTTDITRTIALGVPTDQEKRYFTTVVRAMLRLQEARFLQDTTGHNLDILARGVVWDELIDYQCGTGHGVGHMLSVHEGPHTIRRGIPTDGGVALVEGMIVTDEPGIYLPDELGIRIENELLVVKDKKNEYGQFYHFEPLTVCPIDLEALDTSLMSAREKDALNNYHQFVYKKLSGYLNDEEKVWLKLHTRRV